MFKYTSSMISIFKFLKWNLIEGAFRQIMHDVCSYIYIYMNKHHELIKHHIYIYIIAVKISMLTFTCMHLADTFIQSDLAFRLYIFVVCVFPMNWTHNIIIMDTLFIDPPRSLNPGFSNESASTPSSILNVLDRFYSSCLQTSKEETAII